jgi:hypothetical protein
MEQDEGPGTKGEMKMAAKNMTPEAASKTKPGTEKTGTGQEGKCRSPCCGSKKGK